MVPLVSSVAAGAGAEEGVGGFAECAVDPLVGIGRSVVPRFELESETAPGVAAAPRVGRYPEEAHSSLVGSSAAAATRSGRVWVRASAMSSIARVRRARSSVVSWMASVHAWTARCSSATWSRAAVRASVDAANRFSACRRVWVAVLMAGLSWRPQWRCSASFRSARAAVRVKSAFRSRSSAWRRSTVARSSAGRASTVRLWSELSEVGPVDGSGVAEHGDTEGEGVVGLHGAEGDLGPVVGEGVVDLGDAGAAPAVGGVPCGPLGLSVLEMLDFGEGSLLAAGGGVEAVVGVDDCLVGPGDAVVSAGSDPVDRSDLVSLPFRPGQMGDGVAVAMVRADQPPGGPGRGRRSDRVAGWRGLRCAGRVRRGVGGRGRGGRRWRRGSWVRLGPWRRATVSLGVRSSARRLRGCSASGRVFQVWVGWRPRLWPT